MEIWKKTISPVTNRGYTFTIRDDKIVVLTGTEIYYLDDNGDVIDHEASTGRETKELKSLREYFEDSEGNHYQSEKSFGRFQIIENDSKIIFEEPMGDYIFHCALSLVWLLQILLSLPILITSIQSKQSVKNELVQK